MKLTYFDATGRAEPVRLALAAGGIPYEDVRIRFQEWPAIKPTTPTGSLPLLTLDDGTVLTESLAILRYVGRVCSPPLVPEDALDAARVDELVSMTAAAYEAVGATIYIADEAARRAARAKLMAPDSGAGGRAGAPGPPVATVLAALDARAGSSGWMVGDRPTIADMMVAALVEPLVTGALDGLAPDCLDAFAGVRRIADRVGRLEGVVAYRAAREAAAATQKV